MALQLGLTVAQLDLILDDLPLVEVPLGCATRPCRGPERFVGKTYRSGIDTPERGLEDEPDEFRFRS